MKKIILFIMLSTVCFAQEILPTGVIQKGSLANEKLIFDTKVGVAAQVSVLGCKDLKGFIPYITKMPEGKIGSQSWEEKWVVSGCEKEFPIDIKFAEDGNDGAFWTIKNK